MTQTEARQALSEGKRISHSLFSPHEYLTLNEDGKEVTEEGYVLPDLFWSIRQGGKWEKDWFICRNHTGSKIFEEALKNVPQASFDKAKKELDRLDKIDLIQWVYTEVTNEHELSIEDAESMLDDYENQN
jgi:hypothetical protein